MQYFKPCCEPHIDFSEHFFVMTKPLLILRDRGGGPIPVARQEGAHDGVCGRWECVWGGAPRWGGGNSLSCHAPPRGGSISLVGFSSTLACPRVAFPCHLGGMRLGAGLAST